MTIAAEQGQTRQDGVPYGQRKNRDAERDAMPSDVDYLDSDEMQEKFKKLLAWRRQARIAHAPNREQMAIDEDYYDGIQFDAEDIAILNDRNAPANYFNVTKDTINAVLGIEKSSRIDYNVLPRKKKDAGAAKTKTKIIKYIEDVNRGDYARSLAFADAVKAGVGWLEVGVRSDPDEEPLFVRHENWRNMWFDNLGTEPDLSDYRYVIREKWVDLDIAKGMFPERAEALDSLSTGVNSQYPYIPEDTIVPDNASEFDLETDVDALLGGAYDNLRERVKLVEMWYRMPAKVKVLKMEEGAPYGAMHGAVYRKGDELHKHLLEKGYASLHNAQKMMVRCAMWAGVTLLQDVATPYNHNRFPFVPIFCYRFKRDGMPYGVVRDIRSPQDDLNKRRNKALFLLTANKVIFEEGTINNPAQFADEYNRPDCLAEVTKGSLATGAIKIVDGSPLAAAHVQMAQDNERFIHNIAGVTPEMAGDTSRKLSGVAIQKLNNQSQSSSGVVFDNYYFAFQLAGEIKLANIEQFYDQQKEFRITGEQHTDEFVEINKPGENGEIENAILNSKADFIVGQADYRESIRQAARDTLSDMLTKVAPDVALQLLDLVVDLYDDLPGKDELVARIRKINGQFGPDEEMTPEEKAAKQQAVQQKQQRAQMQMQMQEAMQQLQVALTQAKVEDATAKAEKASADALLAKLKAFIEAMETAGATDIAPHLVQAADGLIQDASELGMHRPQQPQQLAPQQGPQAQQPPPQPMALGGM